jgi:hypothetical protein
MYLRTYGSFKAHLHVYHRIKRAYFQPPFNWSESNVFKCRSWDATTPHTSLHSLLRKVIDDIKNCRYKFLNFFFLNNSRIFSLVKIF